MSSKNPQGSNQPFVQGEDGSGSPLFQAGSSTINSTFGPGGQDRPSPSSYTASPTQSGSASSSPAAPFSQLSLHSNRGRSPADDSRNLTLHPTRPNLQNSSRKSSSGSASSFEPSASNLTRPSKRSKYGRADNANIVNPDGTLQVPISSRSWPVVPGSSQSAVHSSLGNEARGQGGSVGVNRGKSLPVQPGSSGSTTTRDSSRRGFYPPPGNPTGSSGSPFTPVPSGFQHGPTELPPRPYMEGESFASSRPQPPKGKIPGSAMDFLPILEQRFNRLEGAVEQYVEQRAQQALDRSIVPGLDETELSSSGFNKDRRKR